MNRDRIGAIVQARMGSSRLPGKVLRPLAGRPALQYLTERLTRCEQLDLFVIATSTDSADDAIFEWCASAGVAVERGPLANVAQRLMEAADRHALSAFVRLTGDSPLLDQAQVDRGVELFRRGDHEIVTNAYPRRYAIGQSVEVLATDTYRRGLAEMTAADELEHVTLFFYRRAERFRILNFTAESGPAGIDLALDTVEDADRVEAIIARMDRPHWEYSSDEIVQLARALETAREA